MMHHYGNWAFREWGSMYWGWMGLHVLAWVVIGVVLFWLYKRYHKHSSTIAGMSTSLDILKNRYARGEITQEEFNNMKEHIK